MRAVTQALLFIRVKQSAYCSPNTFRSLVDMRVTSSFCFAMLSSFMCSKHEYILWQLRRTVVNNARNTDLYQLRQLLYLGDIIWIWRFEWALDRRSSWARNRMLLRWSLHCRIGSMASRSPEEK